MKTIANIYNLLDILLHYYLFLINIKYGYLANNIYANNIFYFIFYIPRIRQI